MENKLINIANHLLDLGKRNRLLNFKDTGFKSLMVLNKNLEQIFIDITNSKPYSIFMIDPILEKYHNYMTHDEKEPANYTYYKVYDIANNLLKNNELLCFKKGSTLIKVIKSLIREYKFSINEKGINSLYLSFGILNYLEDNINYKAPILLVPIQLYEEKGIYKIKEYEDEIILNPTLKYYFKTTYNITFPEYDDINIIQYFDILSKMIPEDSGIEQTCAIGIYSFLKMNMYEDLITNKEEVIKNKNIQALLGMTIKPEIEKELRLYPVVNCDSSQLGAIKLAASSKSFVLQGPPGSGKSQTITNIISTLIANNKHVLFVSEKLAALNVVYENLRRAGLEEFAIELHSNKANKKEFIENLYKTAILPKYDIDNTAEIIIDNHYIAKETILSYYNELHKVIDKYNLSLYDIYSMYLNTNISSINYKIKNIDDYNIKDLDTIEDLLNNYILYSKNIGYDYKNTPLYGINNISMDYVRYEIDNALIKSISYLNKLLEIKENIDKIIKNNIINITNIYNIIDLITALNSLKTFNNNYLKKENRNKIYELIEEYNKYNKNFSNEILNSYRESILELDLENIFIEYKIQSGKKFKIFNKKFKELNTKLLAYRNKKCKPNIILEDLEKLIIYKNKKLKIDNCLKQLEKFNISNNFELVINDINSLSKFNDIILLKDYKDIKNELTDICISFNTIQMDSTYLNDISLKFDKEIFDFFNSSINEVIYKLKGIHLKKETINEYILLMNTINKIKEINVLDYLDYYLKSGYDINKISLQFKKQFLENVMYKIIDKSIVLSAFSSANIENTISKFKELDEKILNVNRDYIISNISKKRPDDVLVEGSKFKILVREYNKLRKNKPIRLLLNEIFDLALDIKPVFLMSPLSVSTYLSNRLDMFDCVIFDEASQIFAWDALGAIYRAKQCIIIGDNKQMPPSNFFNAISLDEEDDDDLDSILDTASTCFLSSKLKWHYRSRSEELIQFSNQGFYDNELITIPQAKKHVKGFGIDFYHLTNGIYDAKTRTNRVEAEYICDMVFEHFKVSKQSLGVVAFSNVQAALIEQMIENRLSNEPEFREKMNTEIEPFFVKNLESVQGDERDRIIFSVCYGYNEDNKFYQRFGPLNNIGGERRLNVAITRAKYNISVVSSIVASDIKLNNTESLGVKLLRDYLDFAQNVEANQNYSDSNDGIINSVVECLTEKGYECLTNYGTSQFKIDIAVMKNNEFVLAIMVDSKSKYVCNTTDKYRLEKLLLERLGWRYHRLYSTSWINNYDVERKRLLDSLILEEIIEDEISSESFLSVDESENKIESKFLLYKELDINIGKSLYEKYHLGRVIKELVDIEGPIHEDYLLKRVALILEKPRITNVLKNMVNQAIGSDIIKDNRYYYTNLSTSIKLRLGGNRDIDEIYVDELKHGIYTIVSMNNGITIEGCYKLLISLLGFSRVTENTKRILDDALVFLKLDGMIIQRGECLYI